MRCNVREEGRTTNASRLAHVRAGAAGWQNDASSHDKASLRAPRREGRVEKARGTRRAKRECSPARRLRHGGVPVRPHPRAILTPVVRPERRVVLAGGSPVRVSAGAPGSRLQPGGEIRPCRAECQEPLKERDANQRAATISERNSLVIVSAERCLGGPSRSLDGEGNRQHPGPERMLDLPGVAGGGTLGQSNAEQERPYLAASSGKDRAYKA